MTITIRRATLRRLRTGILEGSSEYTVTVGNLSSTYGYFSSQGSIDPDPPNFRSHVFAELFNSGSGPTVDFYLDATGLPQDYFDSIEVETADFGTVTLLSSEADIFNDDAVNGTTRWAWFTTDMWNSNDAGQDRTVTINYTI